jgi:DNA-binding protein H-NS
MSTTIAEAPPTENKTSPFHAALENAFKGDETSPVEIKTEATPKSAEVIKETAKSVPDTLFKKPEADAKSADEPSQAKVAADEITEPPKLDAKGKAGWEALKKTAREESTKRAELEKQIEEWKSKGRDPETLEKALLERDKKLSEYEAKVARVDLESSESFQREIVEPFNREIQRAKAFADEIDANPEELSEALSLVGKARANALRDMGFDLDPVQSGRLGRIIEKMDELHERAESERSNAKMFLDQRTERERLDKLSEHGEFVKTKFLQFEDTTKRLKSRLEILNQVDGHEDWNTKSKAVVENARAYIQDNPYADVEAVIEAKAMPVYRELFLETREREAALESKVAEMEKELKAIHGRSPSLTQRGAAATTGNSKPFSSMIAEAFGQ